jgi:hypothetical protein
MVGNHIRGPLDSLRVRVEVIRRGRYVLYGLISPALMLPVPRTQAARWA